MPDLVRAALSIVLFYGSAHALTVPDLDGRSVDPLSNNIAALLFTRTDCPISNRYAPEVRRISALFAQRGLAFWLVYVDPAQALAAAGKIGEAENGFRQALRLKPGDQIRIAR